MASRCPENTVAASLLRASGDADEAVAAAASASLVRLGASDAAGVLGAAFVQLQNGWLGVRHRTSAAMLVLVSASISL